jgi:hypothetical protein
MVSPVSIRIAPAEYDSFVKAIKDESQFPVSYDEWLDRTLQREHQALANNYAFNQVNIRYKTFTAYIRYTGSSFSYASLMALAAYIALRHQ